MKDYIKAFELAKGLPQKGNTPIYQDFNGNEFHRSSDIICYSNTSPDVADLFNAIVGRRTNDKITIGRGYIYAKQTKVGEDGTILPKGQWRTIVLYHSKWSRHDIEVTNATYDIVGVKRATTHLPAGVLIANIKFEIEQKMED